MLDKTLAKFIGILQQLRFGIGAKIILPYLLLTLIVAGVGAFIMTRLVVDSLEERFNNQLLDAGRIVVERMVDYEEDRLETLRLVTNTRGVPAAIEHRDRETLAALIPQLILNSNMDFVSLIDHEGREVFGWYLPPAQEEAEIHAGASFADIPDVQMVLSGVDDGFGQKRTFVGGVKDSAMIFTIGPVFENDRIVGAAMVGVHVEKVSASLAQDAIAKVTLYDQQGNVVTTSFVASEQDASVLLQESVTQYETIISLLEASSTNNQVVTAATMSNVPLRQVEVLHQVYRLAYGDWRMRDRSFGLFSVALPSNFIITTASNNQNLLGLIFSAATIAVIMVGFIIARRIVRPINQLVHVSTSVSQGNLSQRTGINRTDEIGTLANSFDVMTETLVQRNRELSEQAGKLEAILDSIADGVIVFDQQNQIVSFNPAARPLLESLGVENPGSRNDREPHSAFAPFLYGESAFPRERFQIGSRFFSGTTAPVTAASGETVGRVIVLHDVTREAEAETLKDGLITSISHELRTPLTSIKGYVELLLMSAKDSLDPSHVNFLEIVNNNTDKLIGHVNKLIEISEIQDGSLKLNLDWLETTDLIQDAVAVWEIPMQEKNLALEIKLEGDSLPLYGDAKRLAWALENLLSNAYHFTLPGGQIRVCAEQNSLTQETYIQVTDTGIGIDAADIPYIFTRFFRLQNPQTFNEEGVGLGLFIVKSIVEMHQGRIWIDSVIDQGTTVHIMLPGRPVNGNKQE
jgi:two-component system, OmpR family, phosphate regulon sensor histidine kinase PhoR